MLEFSPNAEIVLSFCRIVNYIVIFAIELPLDSCLPALYL